MPKLAEGIFASDQAMRLMRKKRVDVKKLVAGLQNLMRLANISTVHICKYGYNFQIYTSIKEKAPNGS